MKAESLRIQLARFEEKLDAETKASRERHENTIEKWAAIATAIAKKTPIWDKAAWKAGVLFTIFQGLIAAAGLSVVAILGKPVALKISSIFFNGGNGP